MHSEDNVSKKLRQAQILAQRVKDSGIDITADYHAWVEICLALASLGEDGRALFHQVSSLNSNYQYEEADQKFSNVLQTSRGNVNLGTFIHICQQHGIDTSLPPGRPKGSKESRKKNQSKIRYLVDALNQMYNFRYNVWSKRVEIQHQDGTWEPMGDRDYSTISTQLKDQGLSFADSDLRNLLLSSNFAQDYDIALFWLNSLTKWTEDQPDYIKDFISHIQFGDPEYTDFYMRLIKKWFVGLVGMLSGRIHLHSIMLVLTGGQNVGKTYFARHILPPFLKVLFYEPSNAIHVDKDFIISLSENGLVLLDELSFSNNLMSDVYKHITTSTESQLRDAYGHYREKRERRATLIATTNCQQYIKDSSGDRRYLSVNVASTTNLNESPFNYEGAYAQAMYLLDHGYDCTTTADEVAEISAHNINFRELNDCEDAILTYFIKPENAEEITIMSATEILTHLRNQGVNTNRITTQEIGKAMRNLGYSFKKIGNNTRFFVIPLQFHDVKNRSGDEKAKLIEKSQNSKLGQSNRDDLQMKMF